MGLSAEEFREFTEEISFDICNVVATNIESETALFPELAY